MLPFLLHLDDPLPSDAGTGRLTVANIVSELWISPSKYPDFGWTLLGRVLVNLGNALGTSLLWFFLTFGLGVDDPDDDLLLVSAVYMLFVIASAFLSGALSDRIARRKPFVLAAGLARASPHSASRHRRT